MPNFDAGNMEADFVQCAVCEKAITGGKWYARISSGEWVLTLNPDVLLLPNFIQALVDAGHMYIAQPPLYRIDAGKQVLYALDNEERDAVLKRLSAEHSRAKPVVTRFKGLGEMNPSQLRESTIDPLTLIVVPVSVAPPSTL
jgi:hypothetical protein